MGGTNEKVLDRAGGTAVVTPPGVGLATALSVNAGPIRVHENNGEVHFHDDAAKLKVAVPVPDFTQQYGVYIQSPHGDLIMADFTRMTLVRLTYAEQMQGNIADARLDVTVEKIDTGDVTVVDNTRGRISITSADKTTVSVPTHVFAERLGELLHGDADSVRFIDTAEQTRAVVQEGIAPQAGTSLKINIEKIRATGALAKLNDFVEGR